MSLINKIVMVVLCRIRTPEAYKVANEFFAYEFVFLKRVDSGRAKELWLLRFKI